MFLRRIQKLLVAENIPTITPERVFSAGASDGNLVAPCITLGTQLHKESSLQHNIVRFLVPKGTSKAYGVYKPSKGADSTHMKNSTFSYPVTHNSNLGINSFVKDLREDVGELRSNITHARDCTDVEFVPINFLFNRNDKAYGFQEVFMFPSLFTKSHRPHCMGGIIINNEEGGMPRFSDFVINLECAGFQLEVVLFDSGHGCLPYVRSFTIKEGINALGLRLLSAFGVHVVPVGFITRLEKNLIDAIGKGVFVDQMHYKHGGIVDATSELAVQIVYTDPLYNEVDVSLNYTSDGTGHLSRFKVIEPLVKYNVLDIIEEI